MSINRTVITGNLTRDAELRMTANGMPVLSFCIASNDRRKGKSGEWEEAANYIDCTMFGNRAEGVSPYMVKGAKVCVDGKLRYSSWEKDGQKRSRLEVIADDVELIGGKRAEPQEPLFGADLPF